MVAHYSDSEAKQTHTQPESQTVSPSEWSTERDMEKVEKQTTIKVAHQFASVQYAIHSHTTVYGIVHKIMISASQTVPLCSENSMPKLLGQSWHVKEREIKTAV